ncbi:sugar phosphate isomerase/epimerase family protein [Lignipirellula cremea]|uniref:Xylose isomerase-like TIM barrel n=1 Tax=Lignipirellula cremea TaxID=2528010 RepID=A0A518DMC0_9BACT|nr:sugar phosphate isomerase/epimerase family protein [Lignipirellula cremea]QDU92973.1 Xylose isomerase-like TIM barrel [Lignipirellula cremea]
MLQLRLGLHLPSLGLPLNKGLIVAARLGAQAVEIDARGEIKPRDLTRTGVRHVRKLLEDTNLRICAVQFRTRRGYDDAEDLDRRIEATKEAMKMAYDLGAPIVVNHIGRPPEPPEGPKWQTMIEALTDIGRYGQKIGATLCARTGSESGEDLQRLVAELPLGSLGIDFDPGGLIVNGHSPSAAMDLLAPNVMHLRARDGVRDVSQGRGLATQLGRGSADFPYLLSKLEEFEYRGYVTFEKSHSADAEQEISDAIAYMRSFW